MLSVELGHLADILDQAKQSPDVSKQARDWSGKIRAAVDSTTVSRSFFSPRNLIYIYLPRFLTECSPLKQTVSLSIFSGVFRDLESI